MMGGLRVSPDGSRVVFFDQPVQGLFRGSLKIVDRSRQVTTLTREFLRCWGLAWTPDSSTVIFTATENGDEQTTGQIHAVAAQAGSPVRVLVASAGGLVVTDIAPNGAMLALRHEFRYGMVAMLPGAVAERDVSWPTSRWDPSCQETAPRSCSLI
jgi:Tol biopolymer transport system component